MDKLNIFHLNLRKSSQPSRFICNSLVNFKTVILSVNEPDCNTRTGKIKSLEKMLSTKDVFFFTFS